MNKVLNLELMAHPANWVVLTLMFLLASFGLRFITNAAKLPDQDNPTAA